MRIRRQREGEFLRLLKRHFSIDEFFMEFIKGDGRVAALNNVGDVLVVVTKTFKNLLDEVLMIEIFTKGGDFIGATLDELYVFRDRLRTLDDPLNPILNLLDMSMRGPGIGVRKDEPGLTNGGVTTEKFAVFQIRANFVYMTLLMSRMRNFIVFENPINYVYIIFLMLKYSNDIKIRDFENRSLI